MHEHYCSYAWYPYALPYRYLCLPACYMSVNANANMLHALQQFQAAQQQTSQQMTTIQHQLADIQYAMVKMNQTRQPSPTYIHNEFEKFEIMLDSISLETLSGTLQIGLFNGSSPAGALPPTITTTNITPPGPSAATVPEEAPPSGPSIAPSPVPGTAPGVAPGESDIIGSLVPGTTIPQNVFIPPGLPLPPGASLATGIVPTSPGPEPPSEILPAGATVILPGMTLPPGAIEIAPGIAVLPPGTTPLPAGVSEPPPSAGRIPSENDENKDTV